MLSIIIIIICLENYFFNSKGKRILICVHACVCVYLCGMFEDIKNS